MIVLVCGWGYLCNCFKVTQRWISTSNESLWNVWLLFSEIWAITQKRAFKLFLSHLGSYYFFFFRFIQKVRFTLHKLVSQMQNVRSFLKRSWIQILIDESILILMTIQILEFKVWQLCLLSFSQHCWLKDPFAR